MNNASPMSWRGNVSPEGPLIVSYFTDLFYMRDAFELARSCQSHFLDFVIEQVPDLGSWEANTNYKPTFILDCHKRFPLRDLLWIDADGRFRRYPTLLLEIEENIAYHIWKGRKVASGTVYLPISNLRGDILRTWEQKVREHPHASDQVCLGLTVNAMHLTSFDLPVEYCWIYDEDPYTGEHGPTLNGCPVIEHLQASRLTKNTYKKVKSH